MSSLQGTACCGVKEIYAIMDKKPEQVIIDVCYDLFTSGIPAGIITFTSNDRKKKERGYGEALAEYIEKNKLGPVAYSEATPNPNTSNVIRHFAWTVDHNALKEWYKPAQERYQASVAKLIAPFKVGDPVKLKSDVSWSIGMWRFPDGLKIVNNNEMYIRLSARRGSVVHEFPIMYKKYLDKCTESATVSVGVKVVPF